MASEPQDDQVYSVPLSGTRAQALQRLQIGLFGLGAMVLLVGLANIVIERAEQTEAGTVPEAAATVAPNKASQASDPLADAGVAPEVTQPSPAPTVQHQAQPVIPDALPAQGD